MLIDRFVSKKILFLAESVFIVVKSFQTNPGNVFKNFFRSHADCGTRDRRLIVDIIYNILRNWDSFHWIVSCESEVISFDRRLILLGALATQRESFNQMPFGRYLRSFPFSVEVESNLALLIGLSNLSQIMTLDESSWLLRAVTQFLIASNQNILNRSVYLDLPDWMIGELSTYLSERALRELALSLLSPASVDLRVNTIKIKREKLRERLAESSITSFVGKYSCNAIRLEKPSRLAAIFSESEGLFEIQDEGSQLISHLVAPMRGEMIMDFCAGAGGKALALGAIMRNTGKIFAVDNSAKRLAKLNPRIERSGAKNIYPIVVLSEKDLKLERFIGKIDRVLIDAPCSGVGTLRRNPHLKNWYDECDLNKLHAKQLALIHSAARFVRKGGRLIYATCSLLPSENEKVIEFFLEKNKNFELDDASAILQKQGVTLPAMNDVLRDSSKTEYLSAVYYKCLRLLPSIHNTDGFFAVSMKRIS